MKLCFMKQNALETVKGNLKDVFSRYYTEESNKWIFDVYEDNPFVEFKEVPDFSLAPLDSDLSKGEIDMENSKIIYKNLMFLSESQASDERLWAGLTNGVFYKYMRKRWGYDINPPKTPKKSIGEIKSRYFFEGGSRAGFFRNTLSKCWWVGRALYDKSDSNPFKKLDILGSNDLSTKITDIFYSNTYSSNPEILNGIIKCFEHFNKSGVKLNTREHVRPTLQLLNAIGGGIILDCLSSDEISDIMIENIESIIQGDHVEIESIDDDNYIDEAEVAVNSSDDEIYVTLGCKVTAISAKTEVKKTYKVDRINGSILPILEKMIGMKKGETFISGNDEMKIVDICYS